MNNKWLSHYKEKHGATENQVFNAFFSRKTSDYEILTTDEKTELNQWIEEQRMIQDEHNRNIG